MKARLLKKLAALWEQFRTEPSAQKRAAMVAKAGRLYRQLHGVRR